MSIALTAPDLIFPLPAAQRTDSGKGTGSCAAGKGKRVLCVDRFYTHAAPDGAWESGPRTAIGGWTLHALSAR